MSGELQTIPARHGTATFVPQGQTIKIINTYGKQVVDVWAFALHQPPSEKEKQAEEKEADESSKKPEQVSTPRKSKSTENQPTKSTENLPEGNKTLQKPPEEEKESKDSKTSTEEKKQKDTKEGKSDNDTLSKSWTSYIPSIRSKGKATGDKAKSSAEGSKSSTSKGWSSYIPSGKAFTSRLPSKDTISSYAGLNTRDPEKSYAEQLYDFSKTPVGAAGLSGESVAGSSYTSTLYAAYTAYTTTHPTSPPPMEYLSLPHTLAATHNLTPRPSSTLLSNLRQPLLTLLEDTSPGLHDTLLAACDPRTRTGGSCAENLVLALRELNATSGLKGVRAVGADVSVNTCPTSLSLFMDAGVDGDRVAGPPEGGQKGDFVRLRAERDVVVVMSACPQMSGKSMVAHFVVEGEGFGKAGEEEKKVRKEGAERPKPKKIGSSRANLRKEGTVDERGKQDGPDVQAQDGPPRRKPKKLERRSTAPKSG
ncbi:hypothetical protein M501DRAFT_722336 [Patellaria atrata CBS 101060]|uniref:DUF1989 domain-containing protein n=1 Tax=Patellaria atrata CBS 101060 TaxID=1346257 RepID=A0A9P4SBG7_9PEZI|nr:hypothetical protein M501DRAFT_722336 [Patellaria atrata CBS 101060]